MRHKILIVEDDEKIRNLIKDYLIDENYIVSEAENGMEGYEKFFSEKYSLIILDWMLPLKDGMELCRDIRKISSIPILILTAKTLDEDQIKSFKNGADEFIAKPFNPKLLVLRVDALINRCFPKVEIFSYKNLKINFNTTKTYVNDVEVILFPKETELLNFFIQNKNITLSREKILNEVWGFDYFGDIRTVDSHIKSLRKKIGKNFIKTIRNFGYIFEVNNEIKN